MAPPADVWHAMSPTQRDRLLAKARDLASDPRNTTHGGQRDPDAKGRAVEALGAHYTSIGRPIYLAEAMTVLYPGEEVFTPDILAVSDVPRPEVRPRKAWAVAEEGRGLDFVLEVLHHGDRKKALVVNLERYAQLRILEYFVYDRLRRQIHGYRLPGAAQTRYQPILPQHGRHSSAVLGLALAVTGGELRFYDGAVELFACADLVGRLQGMSDEHAIDTDAPPSSEVTGPGSDRNGPA